MYRLEVDRLRRAQDVVRAELALDGRLLVHGRRDDHDIAFLDGQIVIIVVEEVPAVRRADHEPDGVRVVRTSAANGVADQLIGFGHDDLQRATGCSRSDLYDIAGF